MGLIMSDYYGDATLEGWLKAEVFYTDAIPQAIVNRFGKWRESVESDIEAWMGTDDGEGNNSSWRGWGRGFNGIPDSDNTEFAAAVRFGILTMGLK